MQIRKAQPGEHQEAFELLFQGAGDDGHRRAEHAMGLVRKGDFDANGIFVAKNHGHVDGVVICQILRGAASLVWPPRVRLSTMTEVEDQLVQTALRYMRSGGAKISQTLLSGDEQAIGEPLLRNGFRRITSLWFMNHFLDLTAPILQRAEKLTFRDSTEVDPEHFAQTLLATYEGTQDCPELNGVRTIDEIIEGHRSQGRHRPQLWWMAYRRQTPIGVLLCTQLADSPGWELSYVGVIPKARGHGAGIEMTCKALLETKAADAPHLMLSVDARNLPAWNLYRSLGFEVYDQRDVFLHIW